jgi:transcriptional regulator GlxA family with amidase domain
MSVVDVFPRAERGFTLGILALDGCVLSGVTTPMDALRVAQKIAHFRDPGTPLALHSRLIGVRGQDSVIGATGLSLTGVQAPGEDPDLLLVPGYMHDSGSDVLQRLRDFRPEIDYLRALHLRGVPIASSCTGAFLLAEAGLLDGRRATVSWWLEGSFRHHYPKVDLDVSQLIVEDNGITTTGGSSAVMNFIVRVIANASDEGLAQHTARMLLLDTDRQSQAPYIAMALAEKPRHSLSEKAEHFLREELHRDVTVAELAEFCGTSERSLLRHFHSHYHSTPVARLQHLRVERAKALLESTHLSFDEIVERCGYSDASSFRKLFKRATTLTPAGYRERFRLRAQ